MTQVAEASKLARVVEQNGIAPTNARTLIETFEPYFGKADELCAAAAGVKVTDATQVSEIKKSRELRLALKAVRVEAEKSRKALKEDSLRMGKAIDGINNVLLLQIEPVEKHLEEQEKFAERAEAARKEQLRIARSAALAPYMPDQTAYTLGEMTEPAFAQLLEGARLAHEARIEAEKKAEVDRIAAEEARKAEEARIRAENERLRKEKEEAERVAKAEREAAEAALAEERRKAQEQAAAAAEKARKEREAAEAQAKAEREAREKLERENAAREAAEAKKRAEEEKARRKAAAAPDKVKLSGVAKAVRLVVLPSFASEEAQHISAEIDRRLGALAGWIEAEAAKL
jgi:hypothetical protein